MVAALLLLPVSVAIGQFKSSKALLCVLVASLIHTADQADMLHIVRRVYKYVKNITYDHSRF